MLASALEVKDEGEGESVVTTGGESSRERLAIVSVMRWVKFTCFSVLGLMISRCLSCLT